MELYNKNNDNVASSFSGLNYKKYLRLLFCSKEIEIQRPKKDLEKLVFDLFYMSNKTERKRHKSKHILQ